MSGESRLKKCRRKCRRRALSPFFFPSVLLLLPSSLTFFLPSLPSYQYLVCAQIQHSNQYVHPEQCHGENGCRSAFRQTAFSPPPPPFLFFFCPLFFFFFAFPRYPVDRDPIEAELVVLIGRTTRRNDPWSFLFFFLLSPLLSSPLFLLLLPAAMVPRDGAEQYSRVLHHELEAPGKREWAVVFFPPPPFLLPSFFFFFLPSPPSPSPTGVLSRAIRYSPSMVNESEVEVDDEANSRRAGEEHFLFFFLPPSLLSFTVLKRLARLWSVRTTPSS